MKALISRFAKCESGATAIEYGLIAALIGVFIIGALTLVGEALNNMFTAVATELTNNAPGADGGAGAPAP